MRRCYGDVGWTGQPGGRRLQGGRDAQRRRLRRRARRLRPGIPLEECRGGRPGSGPDSTGSACGCSRIWAHCAFSSWEPERGRSGRSPSSWDFGRRLGAASMADHGTRRGVGGAHPAPDAEAEPDRRGSSLRRGGRALAARGVGRVTRGSWGARGSPRRRTKSGRKPVAGRTFQAQRPAAEVASRPRRRRRRCPTTPSNMSRPRVLVAAPVTSRSPSGQYRISVPQ
jgi:hypothetical protein